MTSGKREALTAAAVVLSIALVLASPASAKRECPRGEVLAAPKGAPATCVELPPDSARGRATALADLPGVLPGEPGAIARRLESELGRHGPALRRFLIAELRGPLGGLPRSAPPGFGLVGGSSDLVQYGESADDPSRQWKAGAEESSEFTLEGNQPETAGMGASASQYSKAVVDRCPTQAGGVPGVFEWRGAQVRRSPGAELSIATNVVAELEGHVDDAARLRDYDAQVTAELLVGGSELVDGQRVPLPTRTYRMRVKHDGLAIERGIFGDFTRWTVRGPKGGVSAAELVFLILALSSAPDGKISDAFGEAFDGWYKRVECLDVEYAPGTLQVRDGGAGTAEVRVTRLSDDRETRFPLAFKADERGVRLIPQEGRAPLSLKVEVPRRFEPERFRVDADGVSRQGRIGDCIGGACRPSRSLFVDVSSRRLPASWSGTASGTVAYAGFTESFSATYRLEGDPGEGFSYYTGPGTMQWSFSGGVAGGCTYSPHTATLAMSGDLIVIDGSYEHSLAGPGDIAEPQVPWSCDDGRQGTAYWPPFANGCARPESGPQPFALGIGALSGSRGYATPGAFDFCQGPFQVDWQWKLQPAS